MSTSLDDLMPSMPSMSQHRQGQGQQGQQGQQGPAGADEEHVRRILAEMNVPVAGSVSIPIQNRVITEPPITTSTGQLRMDPITARANVIGGSTPTAADFHTIFQTQTPSQMQQMQTQPYRTPGAEEMFVHREKQDDWKTTAAVLLRNPVYVGIIVFFLNLPVITGILSRYASWMYLSSGEISVSGIMVKAVLAATMFSLFQVATTFMT